MIVGGFSMKEYTYNIINDVYNWMISKRKNIEVRIQTLFHPQPKDEAVML